jgi:hypothetical protein
VNDVFIRQPEAKASGYKMQGRCPQFVDWNIWHKIAQMGFHLVAVPFTARLARRKGPIYMITRKNVSLT